MHTKYMCTHVQPPTPYWLATAFQHDRGEGLHLNGCEEQCITPTDTRRADNTPRVTYVEGHFKMLTLTALK